jgi:hypothetical protein
MASPAYPVTRYEDVSPKLLDFNSPEVRERMSKPGVKALFNLADVWKLRNDDVRGLLGGGISNGTYFQMKKNPGEKVLDADQLYRISYLIGIFKALNILHGKELADEWIQLPNDNRIFGGRTPLEFMLRGGIPAMQIVRRLLDARRGGA